ncbi:MAG: hypothetical protein ACUVXA_19000 [Candidatus Jordarchaeum sp.]|uniref:hypothetical protein n=1 Tax=Candidatus Jordarchaeum sp. TaxID=2823881 RepID=UPI00404A686B
MVDEEALNQILNSIAKNISSGQLKYAELDLVTAKGMALEDPRVWYYDGTVKARNDKYTEALESLAKAMDLNDRRRRRLLPQGLLPLEDEGPGQRD